MNFDTWSIIILIFAAQGLFTLTILLVSKQKRKIASNRYLVVLIIFIIWVLLEFLSIRNAYTIDIDLFYATRYGVWLIMGPIIHYYYKSIIEKGWKLTIKKLVHILPFIVFVFVIPTISNQSLSSRQIHYGMLAVFDHRPKTVTAFEYLYSTVFYIQFIHFGGYLLFNFKLINTYVKKLKNEYSNINAIIWLKVFNLLLITTVLFSSAYLYILFKSDFYSRSLDYIYILPIGIFIYSIGYYVSGINWLTVHTPQKKYTTSSLKDTDKAALINRLENLMNNQKIYLNNDLRLKHLTSQLNSSSHHLSRLINEHYQCSFFDFINRFRINEAKIMIKEHPKKNLLTIAFDAGFNNKTSFINAFKKFEKITPSTYRKNY